jgi:thiol-disulfide isomerase/thioredoxin
MKSFIFSILTILVFFFCIPKENTPSPNNTIITGQISKHNNSTARDNIQIIFLDLLRGEISNTAYIDENGFFRFEFDLKEASDFILRYSSRLTYFVNPGDSLHFEIDNDCLTHSSKSYAEESAFYNVSGSSININQDIKTFMSLYYDSLKLPQKEIAAIDSLEPQAYAKHKKEQLNTFQSRLEAFSTSKNTSKQFRKWANAYIKYDIWSDLMQYRYTHAFAVNENPRLYVHQMPTEYFSFLNDMANKRNQDLSVSTYKFFLHEYTRYTDQIIPLDSQKVYLAKAEDNLENTVAYLLRYYSTVQKGFIKDVLISELYYRMLEGQEYPRLQNVFNIALIEDQILREEVSLKLDYEKNLYESPPTYAEGTVFSKLDSKKDCLKEIIENNPDKLLYIDFWAPWCSPCISELSNAEKLKEQVEGKDIEFIYLANRCDEKAWKKTVGEKQIEGRHYLLTDRQFEDMKETFGIRGIPHYALINKKGEIISANAPRPSSGKLLNLLSDHLN